MPVSNKFLCVLRNAPVSLKFCSLGVLKLSPEKLLQILPSISHKHHCGDCLQYVPNSDATGRPPACCLNRTDAKCAEQLCPLV